MKKLLVALFALGTLTANAQTFKESNLGGDLTFQIKISSEVAPLIASQRDESFQEIDRIVKDLEPMISEFQARLGKL